MRITEKDIYKNNERVGNGIEYRKINFSNRVIKFMKTDIKNDFFNFYYRRI